MLLPILEQTLTNLPDTGSYDIVKQGVVVLMGNLAKHLDKDDPRVKPIVAKLVSSLSTPSQQVCHHVLMINARFGLCASASISAVVYVFLNGIRNYLLIR